MLRLSIGSCMLELRLRLSIGSCMLRLSFRGSGHFPSPWGRSGSQTTGPACRGHFLSPWDRSGRKPEPLSQVLISLANTLLEHGPGTSVRTWPSYRSAALEQSRLLKNFTNRGLTAVRPRWFVKFFRSLDCSSAPASSVESKIKALIKLRFSS